MTIDPDSRGPVRRGLPRPGAASADPAAASATPVDQRTPSTRPAIASATVPKRYGRFTRRQWVVGSVLGAVVLAGVAVGVVLAARWFAGLDGVRDFLVAYPGEYELPESAPVGLPGWLGWQHFFNVFFITLIIRSGLRVRAERRPPAYWSPRRDPKRRISLTLWFHQSLDVLWVVNGVVYVVLLIVTGQWMRIVPTSWEVFPNAASALLQYLTLDWPTENGWVNYNSLQQLAYFVTVFVAAPLAIATGVRMSGWWPARATRLSRLYPVSWARRLHFPVMLYFVLFIVTHVTLVLATGALRNLNHMYASREGTGWIGLILFAVSLVVIAGGWVAARPVILAGVARVFGRVER